MQNVIGPDFSSLQICAVLPVAAVAFTASVKPATAAMAPVFSQVFEAIRADSSVGRSRDDFDYAP